MEQQTQSVDASASGAFLYYAQEVKIISFFCNKKATICNKREQFSVRVMRARAIFSYNCEPGSPWGVVWKLLQILRGIVLGMPFEMGDGGSTLSGSGKQFARLLVTP
jgi:hypothetical protein